MLQRRQSKEAEAFRPAPAYFSQEQVAEYLSDLRKNRPARPGGARPLPKRNAAATPTIDRELPARAESAMAMRPKVSEEEVPERSSSAMAHKRGKSSLSNREDVGRPLARQPFPNMKSRDFSGATATTAATTLTNTTSTTASSQSNQEKKYSIPYYERGQRWMEKQEMSSLRYALQEKDRREEAKIHSAAQDEAAELVWKHRNPEETGVPYRNPDFDYRHHLRKGSHARSQSIGPFSSLYIKKAGSEGNRSASDGSNTSAESGGGRVVSSSSNASGNSGPDDNERGRESQRQKAYGSLKSRFSIAGPRALIKRRSSSAKGRQTSAESYQNSVFRNPADQIYEEPEDATTTVQTVTDTSKPQPLAPKPRNTSYGSKNKDKVDRSQTDPVKMVSSIDIHKNPPSQSRNAFYKQNSIGDRTDSLPEQPPMKEGKEVRSDDIRAATSMKLKDRSEKLPMPTVVSDRPGRPIVSFANDYKQREKELKEQSSSRPSTREGPSSKPTTMSKPIMPTMNSEPVIPTINVSDAPSIQVNDAPSIPAINISDVPSINLPDVSSISVDAPTINVTPSTITTTTNQAPRPLPKPSSSSRPQPGPRPLPHHFPTSPLKSTPHWTPTSPLRSTAQCASCALPISGRVVTAASQRFHPSCFTCFACSTQLECVAFYPEPSAHRAARLARIDARLHGHALPQEQAHISEAEDGDAGLRFYCHLDFHEHFSPRCRSCGTPIEGEVVVACGGEWHKGHFFCAECGDPFDERTPFVERDGYAWCTGCHTRKFSGKCAGCKRPVLDVVVKALEREWHEECFCCCRCGGGFEGGRFFVAGEGEMGGLPVCAGCEERRLKA